MFNLFVSLILISHCIYILIPLTFFGDQGDCLFDGFFLPHSWQQKIIFINLKTKSGGWIFRLHFFKLFTLSRHILSYLFRTPDVKNFCNSCGHLSSKFLREISWILFHRIRAIFFKSVELSTISELADSFYSLQSFCCKSAFWLSGCVNFIRTSFVEGKDLTIYSWCQGTVNFRWFILRCRFSSKTQNLNRCPLYLY